MAKGDGASVSSSTRAERAAYDSQDFGDPGQMYPQLGRDVPYRWNPSTGRPEMDVQVRVESYGEHGLRRETRCPSCSRWLSYRMCPGCQSSVRMLGFNDTGCECYKDSLWIYGKCEDHRVFEQGPPWPQVA